MRGWIEELPDAWRQALVLREQQELSYKEIAELLEASEPQVKTWLHRARARLLGQMAEDDMRKPGENSPAKPGERPSEKVKRQSVPPRREKRA
jgi:transposase